eukprot:NODE_28610_length_472_cov_0.831884.p3 GENE.NODE_28610_length_472_cov_0.831884~~NODE_28610_length_472_cov_0.831884.p3  ORF type:complete len:85 (-),score=17.23 NODE_28610_length_472_cov_0.831884:96-350(-)
MHSQKLTNIRWLRATLLAERDGLAIFTFGVLPRLIAALSAQHGTNLARACVRPLPDHCAPPGARLEAFTNTLDMAIPQEMFNAV